MEAAAGAGAELWAATIISRDITQKVNAHAACSIFSKWRADSNVTRSCWCALFFQTGGDLAGPSTAAAAARGAALGLPLN